MQGKFNLKYFFLGKGFSDWFSAWGSGWRIFITLIPFVIAGLILYRAFFMKTTVVKVGKGGTAIINQVKKRFFIPFIEGYAGQENDRDMHTGIRAGLRFEF